jgi:glycosyltransferase involved in cell wall biosynthesis
MDQSRLLPKVSIIIPVYNGTNYLKNAIDSALAQTYSNLEIIVINDGSTDEGKTENLALSYGEKITYYYKENGGVASALNKGIEHMTGDYFSWLSHDDMYTSDKIEKEVNTHLLTSNRNSIVFCSYQTTDSKGEIIEDYHLPKNVSENIRCLLALDTTYTLNGCTTLIPRHLLTDEMMFNTKLRYTQDYDLWFRFSEKVNFIYLDECLVKSRQHESQDSRSGGSIVTEEADLFHCRAINNLDFDLVNSYIQGNPRELRVLYETYLEASYTSTSAVIFNLIMKYTLLFSGPKATKKKIKEFLGLRLNENQEIPSFSKEKRVSNKPVVTFFNNVWTYGGIERVLSILFKELNEKYQIILISGYIPDEQGFSLPQNVTHYKIDLEHRFPLSLRVAELSLILRSDVFVGNPNILKEFLPVYGILKNLNIKTILSNHYYYFLPYKLNWLRPIASERKLAFNKADVVLWLTNYSAALNSGTCNHVGVIPNPNTYGIIEPREYPKEKIVLAVGRFYDSIKRLDYLFKLFSKIYEKDSQSKLIIVGDYPPLDSIIPQPVNQSIKSILNKCNIPVSSYSFVGEQKDVSPYYKIASLYLMTSDCEGFGMVLTEAGVYGIPVLVYGTPGLEDIIVHGQNGYITEVDEIENASVLAVEVLNSKTLWIQMSLNAQALATRFLPKKVAERWELLFTKLLNENEEPISEYLVSNGFSPKRIQSGWVKNTCKEYEKCLYPSYNLIGGSKQSENDTLTEHPEDDIYYQEMLAIQSTFSWRITQPLRDVKSVLLKLNPTHLLKLLNVGDKNRQLENEIVSFDEKISNADDLLNELSRLEIGKNASLDSIKFLSKEVDLVTDPNSILKLFKEENDSRTTIAVYSCEWLQGGTERVLSILLNELSKYYRIVFFSIYIPVETGFVLSDHILHLRIKRDSRIALPDRLAVLAKLSSAKIFWGNSNLALEFLPVYGILKKWDIRSIVLNHYFYLMPYNNPVFYDTIPVSHKEFVNADVVLWLTNYSAILCKGLHENVGVMPNPNSYQISSILSPRKRKQVLAVGRFDDGNKRIDKILKVFKLVYGLDSNSKLIVVGSFSFNKMLPFPINKSISALISELHIPEEAIKFMGSQSNVKPFFEAASVLLLASDYEGFPMVLTEAGTFGIPSVVFGTPGMDEIIVDGVNGYLIDENKPDIAAEKIISLLNDDLLWRNMSEQCLRLSERFKVNIIVDRWRSLFSLLLGVGGYTITDLINSDFYPKDNVFNKVDEISRVYEEIIETSFGTYMKNRSQVVNDVYSMSYFNQVEKMKYSLSWKLTKPLRLMIRVYSSTRRIGLIKTAKLIKRKIQRHF